MHAAISPASEGNTKVVARQTDGCSSSVRMYNMHVGLGDQSNAHCIHGTVLNDRLESTPFDGAAAE